MNDPQNIHAYDASALVAVRWGDVVEARSAVAALLTIYTDPSRPLDPAQRLSINHSLGMDRMGSEGALNASEADIAQLLTDLRTRLNLALPFMGQVSDESVRPPGRFVMGVSTQPSLRRDERP